jgi:hypothetical protein
MEKDMGEANSSIKMVVGMMVNGRKIKWKVSAGYFINQISQHIKDTG